ncbi:Mini-ribonuclease 3 [Azotosporobacter soli]|uniref:Mini-ribonuclease 3 n=1 Tax=Azotosporobacter soli TaxID=3055040 RepID=UPI0031FE4859
MKFEQFQFLMERVLEQGEGEMPAAGQVSALAQAYIGDAVFSLYVRTRLLTREHNKVHILHSYDSRMVSAAFQAKGYRAIEADLSDEEAAVVRRGRNAKSTVPKSATVAEYRASTGVEALLGFLYLDQRQQRLQELLDCLFVAIIAEVKPAGTRKSRRADQ